MPESELVRVVDEQVTEEQVAEFVGERWFRVDRFECPGRLSIYIDPPNLVIRYPQPPFLVKVFVPGEAHDPCGTVYQVSEESIISHYGIRLPLTYYVCPCMGEFVKP